MKKNDNLLSFESHLDEQYGVIGTATRTAYEKGFEKFKIAVLLEIAPPTQKGSQPITNYYFKTAVHKNQPLVHPL